MTQILRILVISFLAIAAASARADELHLLPAPPAASSPSPEAPLPKTDSEQDYRWEFAYGFAVQHLRNPVFSRTTYGMQTSVTYFLQEFLGLEGNIAGNCFCDGVRHNDEKVEIVFFNVGPHITWHRSDGQPHKRPVVEPWAHALGITEYPQTALGSLKAWASQFGGGVDLRIKPALSWRVQGDYVRSQLFILHKATINSARASSSISRQFRISTMHPR